MTALLVELQRRWSGRTDELIALGLPDWRAPALGPAIAAVIARTESELSAADRSALAQFVRDLPARFAALAACGIADTLVHGDFHPGNLRGDRSGVTLLDWGDSGVGHPLLDQPAFLDRIPKDAIAPVREHWLRLWRKARPGCDPVRASALIAPIAAARQAVIYRGFLDAIDPVEHPYHRFDPAEWLARAAALIRAGS
jgi:aminoglycoside phosphotransferase (APT) family kinase protein